MSTPAEIGLKRWHDIIQHRDPSRLPAIIAEGAVFRSPAVHTPQPLPQSPSTVQAGVPVAPASPVAPAALESPAAPSASLTTEAAGSLLLAG